MPNYLAHDLILHLVIFQLVNLAIILSNYLLIHRARRHGLPEQPPPVSVLLPARNEEGNIEACVHSLLAQDYPDFEVLVLDDQSTDQTRQLLTELAAPNACLRILDGRPAQGELMGKVWACTQLAQQAQGQIFVFTDADTVHHPQMLAAVVAGLHGEEADMITGYPRQIVRTWGERLLVPFFGWATYSFSPLALAYRLHSTALASAVGQLLVFRRDAYEVIGGHAGLGKEIVDDLALTRRIITGGFRWRVMYAADLITCRMYTSSHTAYEGFVKNLFAAFQFRLIPFVFVFAWLGVMFFVPLTVAALGLLGITVYANVAVLGVCLVLSLLVWALPYQDMKIPLWLALVYPLTVLANIYVAIRSCQRTLSGDLAWKGRKLEHVKWTWY